MKKKTKKKAAKKARKDRRYKDADDAPEIVSEKRLTFFLPDVVYREMKLTAARNAVANCDLPDDEHLPETPSSIAREAIVQWLESKR